MVKQFTEQVHWDDSSVQNKPCLLPFVLNLLTAARDALALYSEWQVHLLLYRRRRGHRGTLHFMGSNAFSAG